MRSSKSRSRSKSNRSRSMGNITNRVFDSSGPEGKVRGTPQQIIDKYTQLARDAQLSNDRVAAENFQQHAEHYARMLGEAQREMEARREQQEAQQAQQSGHQNGGQGGGQSHGQNGADATARNGHAAPPRGTGTPNGPAPEERGEKPASNSEAAPAAETADQPAAAQPADILDVSGPEGDSTLVETPESAPKSSRSRLRSRSRSSRSKETEAAKDAPAEPVGEPRSDGEPEAAE